MTFLRLALWPMRSRFNQLQARIALVLGLVLVLPLAFSVFQVLDAYRGEQQQQKSRVAALVSVITGYESAFFERMGTLLDGLASEPVIALGGMGCNDWLSREHATDKGLASISVLAADGTVICSSDPTAVGEPPGSHDFVTRLLAGERDVISKIVYPDDNDSPMMALGTQFDADYGPGRVVILMIDLRAFADAVRALDLPPDGVAFLVDAEGQLVTDPARFSSDYIGGFPARGFAVLTSLVGASHVLEGRDGIERVYVADDLAQGRLFIITGIRTKAQFAWLNRDLVIGILAPMVLLSLAVVAIWVATNALVNRHIKRLVKVARAYSRGDLAVRADLDDPPEEFRELAAAFDHMIERVRLREEELKASLEQKEMLIKEIHHRVKNNLQVVTSLLSLRARNIASRSARAAMHEAQTRIRALALVHRGLYEQDEMATLELDSFLRDLAHLLEDAAGPHDDSITLSVDSPPLRLPTERTIPLALIIVEAVSNAFKHAYGEGETGSIRVRVTADGDRGRLVIEDDGVGLQPASDEEELANSMGLTLVEMFTKQLGGQVQVSDATNTDDSSRPCGTVVVVDFPLFDSGPKPAESRKVPPESEKYFSASDQNFD